MKSKETFISIGGVAAGMSAASRARRNYKEMRVIAFEKGSYVSYGACGLPYFVADMTKTPDEVVVHPPEFFIEKRNIETFTRHEVQRINPKSKKVYVVDLDSGKEMEFPYTKLAITTGAKPKKFDAKGCDLENIVHIKTMEDGIFIKEFIKNRRPKTIAIIGGGYIAFEMAEAFRAWDIETIIVKRPGPILRNFLDSDLAEMAEDEVANHGVKLVKNADIQGFEGNDQGEVKSFLVNNKNIPVDMVLIAIGVEPDSLLAREAGLTINDDGTIHVDDYMRTSDPNIFAAGDCVGITHFLTGRHHYIPRGTIANKQGRIAGENATGGKVKFYGAIGTAVSKIFDLTIGKTGLTSREAEEADFDFAIKKITAMSHAHTYPNPQPQPITIKLLIDKKDKTIIGAQAVGRLGVALRIDILASIIYNRMDIRNLSNLDLCYAPPYAPVWDPILVAATEGAKLVI
jgi:NADPH-dependent 2,4-dienoyl-CoA reductase/sulfur reductase-like enzyme